MAISTSNPRLFRQTSDRLLNRALRRIRKIIDADRVAISREIGLVDPNDSGRFYLIPLYAWFDVMLQPTGFYEVPKSQVSGTRQYARAPAASEPAS